MSEQLNYDKISKYNVLLSLLTETMCSMENGSFENGFNAIWEKIGLHRWDYVNTETEINTIVDGQEKSIKWYDLDEMLLDIVLELVNTIEKANRNENGSLILITEE